MRARSTFVLCALTVIPMSLACQSGAEDHDPRAIRHGFAIPSQGYCDQPYVVVLDDGVWLCTLTTGPDAEGATRQHVVSTRSSDQGKTWEPLVDIEPFGPPEASWVTPLKTPNGRVYAFYDYNADNLRSVMTSNGKAIARVDTLGQFVFKYSDDGGHSWSAQRYRIPVREFSIDRENIYHGAVRFMWSVAKPIIHDGSVCIGMSKVGNFGAGFIVRSEGVILRSADLISVKDPAQAHWETLPDGDTGLRAPEGAIAEEHNLTALSDGSLFCTYRTTQGRPCAAYSRDGGHTWTAPAWMAYTPGGRAIRHPRAANFVRRFSNGKYLYWFHNHGGQSYEGRNPVWISGGIERNSAIWWSQPEILLYDDDPAVRMSYPDFIEDRGRFFITETQKSVARVHEIPHDLLDALWGQFDTHSVSREGLDIELTGPQCRPDAVYRRRIELERDGASLLPSGFTVDLRFSLHAPFAGGVLLDARDGDGKGYAIVLGANDALAIVTYDALQTQRFESDPDLITLNAVHNVSIIFDRGPRVLLFVVDGQLCDGAYARPQGWYRLPTEFVGFNRAATLRISNDPALEIHAVRVYSRPIRVSDAVGNHRAP